MIGEESTENITIGESVSKNFNEHSNDSEINKHTYDLYTLLDTSTEPVILKFNNLKKYTNISDDLIGELYKDIAPKGISNKEEVLENLDILFMHLADTISQIKNGIVIDLDTGELDIEESNKQAIEAGMIDDVKSNEEKDSMIFFSDEEKKGFFESIKEISNETNQKNEIVDSDNYAVNIDYKLSEEEIKKIYKETKTDNIINNLGENNYNRFVELSNSARIRNKEQLDDRKIITYLCDKIKSKELSAQDIIDKGMLDSLSEPVRKKLLDEKDGTLESRIQKDDEDFWNKKNEQRYYRKVNQILSNSSRLNDKDNFLLSSELLFMANRKGDFKIAQKLSNIIGNRYGIDMSNPKFLYSQISTSIGKEFNGLPQEIDFLINEYINYRDKDKITFLQDVDSNIKDKKQNIEEKSFENTYREDTEYRAVIEKKRTINSPKKSLEENKTLKINKNASKMKEAKKNKDEFFINVEKLINKKRENNNHEAEDEKIEVFDGDDNFYDENSPEKISEWDIEAYIENNVENMIVDEEIINGTENLNKGFSTEGINISEIEFEPLYKNNIEITDDHKSDDSKLISIAEVDVDPIHSEGVQESSAETSMIVQKNSFLKKIKENIKKINGKINDTLKNVFSYKDDRKDITSNSTSEAKINSIPVNNLEKFNESLKVELSENGKKLETETKKKDLEVEINNQGSER